MKYYALIPLKALVQAKTRLSSYLSLEERKELVLEMATHVIKVLESCDEIVKIFLVTPDKSINKHITSKKVTILHEEKSGLNSALKFASAHIDDAKVRLLTISADLPLLNETAIHELINLLSTSDIVLAPSKDNGTNAILMKPFALPYLFGRNSYEKFKKEATKRNLKVSIYKNQTTAFDIDTIDDIEKLKRLN